MNSCKLVMFSGGVDSTYLLWKLLTETDHHIHAHHISLRTVAENRWEMEGISTTNLWLEMLEIRHFDVSSTVIDFDTLPYTGWDSDAQLYIGARVAAAIEADDVTLTLGITSNDAKRSVIVDRVNRNVLHNLWAALLDSIDEEQRVRINPKIDLPIKDMSKQDIVRALPENLRQLTWSCRLPVKVEGMTVPCGICLPCQVLQDALK